MTRALLTRLVVAASIVIVVALMIFDPGQGIGVNATTVNGHSFYRASSSPPALIVSLILVVLYLWVFRRKAQGRPSSETAGLWMRFWAFAVDFFLVTFILSPWAGFLALLREYAQTGSFQWIVQRDYFLPGDVGVTVLLVLCGFPLLLGYFVLPQYLGRPSPGSVLVGICLKYDADTAPPLGRVIGRVLLSYVALAGFFLSVPMALCNPEKRMWQDKVCGTRVVRWSD